MAKSPYKHPTAFVGCPYSPKASYEALKKALQRVPIEFIYADSSIKTKHVLDRIRAGIVRADFCLFDITDWNANVTLELGLAEGLNKDYYVAFKPGRGPRKEPPSDLKGLQRFQYSSVQGFAAESLTYQLNMKLVQKCTHPRYVWDRLSGPQRDKQFCVAMAVLAHFKTYNVLKRKDVVPMLTHGSFLRDDAINEVFNVLHQRKLITGRLNGDQWGAGKDLYKHVTL